MSAPVNQGLSTLKDHLGLNRENFILLKIKLGVMGQLVQAMFLLSDFCVSPQYNDLICSDCGLVVINLKSLEFR